MNPEAFRQKLAEMIHASQDAADRSEYALGRINALVDVAVLLDNLTQVGGDA
jgi:hypothetical protein